MPDQNATTAVWAAAIEAAAANMVRLELENRILRIQADAIEALPTRWRDDCEERYRHHPEFESGLTCAAAELQAVLDARDEITESAIRMLKGVGRDSGRD